jgi:hypothetical protein
VTPAAVGPPPWRVVGVVVRDAFFPRVLVHLVGFGRGIPERVTVQPDPGMLLEAVPQFQQVHPVAAQLTSQLRRRDALGDAAEDQDDLRGSPLHALEGRAGEGVEDAAATAALVVQDGVAMAAMHAEAAAGAAARAGQPAGVEHGDELLVAGVRIHQVDEGEVHGGGSPDDRANPPEWNRRQVCSSSGQASAWPHEPYRFSCTWDARIGRELLRSQARVQTPTYDEDLQTALVVYPAIRQTLARWVEIVASVSRAPLQRPRCARQSDKRMALA